MKTLLKFTAVILVISSMLLLFSCLESPAKPKPNDEENNGEPSPFYPEGYTAGFPKLTYDDGITRTEFWWVETYEECLAAIELLESHGSSFEYKSISTYEGDLFDVKYCFEIPNWIINANIKFGDNPFDRYAANVRIRSYAFFEDVTIDEINYGDIRDYAASGICRNPLIRMFGYREVSFENIEVLWVEKASAYYVLDNREIETDMEWEENVITPYIQDGVRMYYLLNGKILLATVGTKKGEQDYILSNEAAWAIYQNAEYYSSQVENFYPEGYTAGFPSYTKHTELCTEFWWVETYEECLAAIELLKSHGSIIFLESAIFTGESDLFDTKYCFEIPPSRYKEDIEFGDNPFDREAAMVKVYSYAFFDDVTIDEINHGDVMDYNFMKIEKVFDENIEEKDFPAENIKYEFNEEGKYYGVLDTASNQWLFSLSYHSDTDGFPSNKDECAWVIANSVKIIGYKN